MAFGSASRRVVKRHSEAINGAGLSVVTPRWSVIGIGDQTPRDVAFDADVICEPTTAAQGSEISLSGPAISDLDLDRGIRVSADIRGTTQGTDNIVQLALGASTASTFYMAIRFRGITGGGGDPAFLLIWGGTTVTFTPSPAAAENVWYRVGYEILPLDNIVRGYANLTAGATGESGNAGMQLIGETTFQAALMPTLNAPHLVGWAGSNSATQNPSGAMPDFNGLNDVLIEWLEGPTYAPGEKPTGTFFQDMAGGRDPYRYYKGNVYLHELLTQARIL